eukprot:474296-Prymnesium_polylepis.1
MAPKHPGRRTPRRSPCSHSTCTLIYSRTVRKEPFMLEERLDLSRSQQVPCPTYMYGRRTGRADELRCRTAGR